MTSVPPGAPLTARIEEQLAENGLQIAVESSDGSLILSGIVDTEEARQAALDIVTQIAPNARVDNQIEVETILPTDVDNFIGDEPTAVLGESVDALVDGGGEIEPDIIHRTVVTDPVGIVGDQGDGPQDVAAEGETYTPPDDPVVTTDAHGRTQVLGGFDSSSDDAEVDLSSDGQVGDEALADAVRRELRQDSSTTDLTVAVVVRNGIAHLRGRVPDLDDADNAEAVAARVPGIREVVEELDVINV